MPLDRVTDPSQHTSARVLHAIAIEDLLPSRNVPLCVEQKLLATCCTLWDPALKPNFFLVFWVPVASNSWNTLRWQHRVCYREGAPNCTAEGFGSILI